jgi:hypothetical protein
MVQSLIGAEDFSSSPCVQTGSGAHPASYPMGTRGPYPGCKARPGRDAGHSPPSGAEVKYEQELYLLSPHMPPWHVAGQLYFFFALVWNMVACALALFLVSLHFCESLGVCETDTSNTIQFNAGNAVCNALN